MPPDFVPTVKSHGNSKESLSFHPTWPSTKQRIKKECIKWLSLKHTVASLSADAGGVLKTAAPEQLPRNEKQVSYYKAKASKCSSLPGTSQDAAADDLFVLMQKAIH